MATKLTRLTHKVAIKLHLVAESCTICSSRSRRPIRKLLDTPLYFKIVKFIYTFTTIKVPILQSRTRGPDNIHDTHAQFLSSSLLHG
jgi:hypothetical protein